MSLSGLCGAKKWKEKVYKKGGKHKRKKGKEKEGTSVKSRVKITSAGLSEYEGPVYGVEKGGKRGYST